MRRHTLQTPALQPAARWYGQNGVPGYDGRNRIVKRSRSKSDHKASVKYSSV